MHSELLLLVAGAVLLFALVSNKLAQSPLTGPLAFLGLGLMIGPVGFGWLHASADSGWIHGLAELTLALVLFGDAARIDLRALKRQPGLPLRLLGIGLPLSIVVGAACVAWTVPELGLMEAALVAAILAPTDAALGQAVVSSRRVPLRLRQALNVESGLNDGLALPVVLLLAVSAGAWADAPAMGAAGWARFAALGLTVGPIVGIAAGWLGGRLIKAAHQRNWLSESFESLTGVALGIGSFALAEVLGGNGFLAAFTAGAAFGTWSRQLCHHVFEFLEAEGQLLVLLVFLVLGAALAPEALAHADGQVWLAALLLLTIGRLIPVSLSLARTQLRPRAFAFLGWFGPRGLASVVFALFVRERVDLPHADLVFSVVVVTALLSTTLHGLSAAPAARAYGRASERQPCPQEARPVLAHPVRGVPLESQSLSTPMTESP